jgi:GNAT superfamily N-acetyltransferase
VRVEETVRTATHADVDAIVELELESRSHLPEVRGGTSWLADNPAIDAASIVERLTTPTDDLVLVGELDGVVLGFATATIARRDSGEICDLTRLYGSPGGRELGLGELMLEAATEWARSRGCTAIESFALPGDRETKNLFERFGMKARLLVVHRSLDATADAAPPVGGDDEV